MKRSEDTADVLKIPNDAFFLELRDILAAGESVTIRATGRSMTPTFRDAVDKVTISSCNPNDIAVGDVVLFDRGDTICLHRVIEVDGRRLTIRGDGNSHSALEYADADKVIGRVIAGTMKGGVPFTIDDEKWRRNTRLILRYHLPVSLFHRTSVLLKAYPLSLLALALLLFLSFFNPGDTEVPQFEYADKIAHLIMYCGLSSVFWFEWFRRHVPGRKTVFRGLVFCFVLPLVLSGVIELCQEYLVSYRGGEWLDFLANATGCLLGVMVTFVFTIPFIRRLKLCKVYGK